MFHSPGLQHDPWWSLCGRMIPRAIQAVASAIVRASHARLVKDIDADKRGYSGPPGWYLGVTLTTPPHKKVLLQI